MLGRHALDQPRRQPLEVERRIFLLVEAVAHHRRPSADPEQEAHRPNVAGEDAQEHLLMIAHQEADSAPGLC